MGQTFNLESTRRSNGDDEGALIVGYMSELDDMRSTIARFVDMDPSDVLLSISGLAGRLAEIRAQLQRSSSQRCTALRAREVDPLREELDLQFRVWSRRIALMEWELKLSGGAT